MHHTQAVPSSLPVDESPTQGECLARIALHKAGGVQPLYAGPLPLQHPHHRRHVGELVQPEGARLRADFRPGEAAQEAEQCGAAPQVEAYVGDLMVGGDRFLPSLPAAAQPPVDPTGACLLLDFKALLFKKRDKIRIAIVTDICI
jgi:hypothetical protein